MAEASQLWKFRGDSPATAMAIGSQGRYGAVGGRHSGIVFLGQDGRPVWRSRGINDVRDISLAGAGRAVLVASGDNTVHYLDQRGREMWHRSLNHAATTVGVSRRADLIVAGLLRGSLHAYNRTGKLLWEHRPGGTDFRINDVSISANGQYVAVGTDYAHIYLYSASGTVLWSVETTGKVLETCISSNGDYISYLTDDQRIYFAVKNSRVVWEYRFDRQPLWIDMVGTADFVVVGETPHKVSIFSKSGRRTWSFKLQTPGTIGRLADSGGNILVGGRNDEVTMLGIEAYLARLLRQTQRLVERARTDGLDAHEAEQEIYAAERALEDGAHQEFLDTIARTKNAVQEAPVARKAVAETAGSGGNCSNCGTGNQPGFQFCGVCGQKLEQGCPSCGTQLQPGFQFCGNCGTQI